MSTTIKNIAIIGASGNLGGKLLAALLRNNLHHITVLTRPSSSAEYDPRISIKRGDYDDKEFLASALQGQEVLISTLGFAGKSHQATAIEAAAKAGVRYFFPADYGAPAFVTGSAFASQRTLMKADLNKRIEGLRMKWVGVVAGPWLDFGLQDGALGIWPAQRKAEVYTDGVKFNTTTVGKVAASIAGALALPRETFDAEFGNDSIYVSSFSLSQPELFQHILRITGTTEADWSVEKKTTQNLIEYGERRARDGDAYGNIKVLFGNVFQEGHGGEYSDKLHNEMLGLKQEDLDQVIKTAVESTLRQ